MSTRADPSFVTVPLDRVRASLLRVMVPHLGRWITRREWRVALSASMAIVTAFVASSIAPLWVIALGPLVWGVPHLLSDIRFLVIRPGLHRLRLSWALAACGFAGGIAGYGLRAALLGGAAALAVAPVPRTKRLMGLALMAPFFAAAWHWGWYADAAFAHLHNLFAVAIWFAWRRRSRRLHWLPLGVLATATFAIASGFALAPPALPFLGFERVFRGIDVRTLMDTIAPVSNVAIARRLVQLYAFGQSVHYVMWLHLIPEEDRASETPRSFAQSLRAVRRDLPKWLLAGAVAVAVGLAAFAFHDVGRARDVYLGVAFFHNYLEIAAVPLLLAGAARAAGIERWASI